MEMVNIGTQDFTVVMAGKEVDCNGTSRDYYISKVEQSEKPAGEYGHIQFQSGPVKENGVNGCHQEDLIAIVIHRLQSFQKSNFACRENALALTKLEEALHWLKHRTDARKTRGVEGTNQK